MTNEEIIEKLIQWYIEREKKLNAKDQGRERELIFTLEINPELYLYSILADFDSDIMDARAELHLAEKPKIPPEDFAEKVLEAVKKEFLK
jgi:hypothetical protein